MKVTIKDDESVEFIPQNDTDRKLLVSILKKKGLIK
jgi:hypothetical protein